MNIDAKTQHPAWVEVDLGAVKHNIAEIRKLVGNVRMMAVVKADAYGHGAVETSKAILSAGADALAVTRLEEGLELRRSGITSSILVFDSTLSTLADEVVSSDLDQTVCTLELAQALSSAAVQLEKTAKVHVKVDTGMGRLGLLPNDIVDFVRVVSALPGIEIAGTYTHFATALECDLSSAKEQLRKFESVISVLKAEGLPTGTIHAANSAAIVRMPQSRFDMVRPGTLIYGQYPSRYVPEALSLQDTWKLKARISFVKAVPSGYAVGYGSEFRTSRPSTIAILPIGYADGFTMAPESVIRRQMSPLRRLASIIRPTPRLAVTVAGRKAPVVGRVAMQMCAIDITDIPGVSVGDEVIIPARRLAVSPRIPKVYKD